MSCDFLHSNQHRPTKKLPAAQLTRMLRPPIFCTASTHLAQSSAFLTSPCDTRINYTAKMMHDRCHCAYVCLCKCYGHAYPIQHRGIWYVMLGVLNPYRLLPGRFCTQGCMAESNLSYDIANVTLPEENGVAAHMDQFERTALPESYITMPVRPLKFHRCWEPAVDNHAVSLSTFINAPR